MSASLDAGEQTQQEFEGTVSLKVGYRYLLALPEGYEADTEKKWPLIIFLHGAGERGEDLEMVKRHGPPKLIAAGKDLGAIVASPQAPTGALWDAHGVKALADDLATRLRVDQDRIYLTGLSMGGFGTWETALEYPGTFAAIIPICGGAGVRWLMAERIKDLPAWIFHGAQDKTVEPAQSERMFQGLKKAGGQPLFTLYPEAGHDSWTATYDDPEVWKWLLSQRRGGS